MHQVLIFLVLPITFGVHAQETAYEPPATPPTTPSDASSDDTCETSGGCGNPAGNNLLFVGSLSPSAGPLDGETRVIIYGHGYRNFGSLMKCRFGTREVGAKLYTAPNQVTIPGNHTSMQCVAPRSPTPHEQDVVVEVTLNGNDFTSNGRVFRYYRHPLLTGVSPSRGSAQHASTLTLTRSTAAESGSWSPIGEATVHSCKFEAIIQPEGKRQVVFTGVVNATVADETEMQCASPSVSFVAPVRVEVSLNGQQFGSGGPLFTC